MASQRFFRLKRPTKTTKNLSSWPPEGMLKSPEWHGCATWWPQKYPQIWLEKISTREISGCLFEGFFCEWFGEMAFVYLYVMFWLERDNDSKKYSKVGRYSRNSQNHWSVSVHSWGYLDGSSGNRPPTTDASMTSKKKRLCAAIEILWNMWSGAIAGKKTPPPWRNMSIMQITDFFSPVNFSLE